jgi:hypothetical protein
VMRVVEHVLRKPTVGTLGSGHAEQRRAHHDMKAQVSVVTCEVI